MYLAQVLTDIKKESSPPKTLHAEHLFKLNEAVFNLPEEDTVDTKMAVQLFKTVEKIKTAYNTGKYDNADSNFFYDYLALLGTMQNQHFFSQKQTEHMLNWIKEVVDEGQEKGGSSTKALEAKVKELEKKLSKYEAADPKTKGKGKEEPPAKSKGKGKGKAPEPEEPPKGKGKKGKKAPVDDYDEEPPAKGKGKGKGICYDFRDNGSCRFGDECRFSHEVA
mmetsp:Transcript_98439/g.211003  ORF Transcript_98439/g.211003 Transcript_98439/m.211003 type:complete len:221 (+) Transcript_98439:97-759(+)